jgi:site-specific DNA-cytosine methylase
VSVTHFHLFCGLGGGALGGEHVDLHANGLRGSLRCLGGVDADPVAVRTFGRLVGVPGTRLDLFSREQYAAFHGHPPPASWREATAEDLRIAAGGEAPDIVVSSPPCKGFSGLLSEERSLTPRYQALNGLTLRGIDLALEAWAAEPPAFWLLENVPRLLSRGRHLLGQIVERLEAAGYEVAWTVPDLGELGGLAQSRKRLHLVARHRERCPVVVFEPPARPLRAIGDVLGPLPLPGTALGPLHELPRLSWLTWLRLALIPAGRDWRALRELRLEDGVLADLALVPEAEWRNGGLGVRAWRSPANTVTGNLGTAGSSCSIADPRCPESWGEYAQYGVQPWGAPSGTITGNAAPGGGPCSIADPRLDWRADASPCKMRVSEWEATAGTITGTSRPGNGCLSIADPRLPGTPYNSAYRVVSWERPSVAVTGGSTPSAGGVAIADPRLPEATERGAWCIRAVDGTWHRPKTVLERAALQGLLGDHPERFADALEGVGKYYAAEMVGNAIPPPAMAESLRAAGVAILLSRHGHSWALGSTPVWVRPFARAILAGGV